MSTTASPAPPRRVLFVTGTLAEPALRRMLDDMSPAFACDVAVLRITVAALMTTPWIARFLDAPPDTDLILIPGLCEGDVAVIAAKTGVAVRKGPKDLREIPEYFGHEQLAHDYGAYDIEIVAEINNAPRLSPDEIRTQAEYYREAGADVIDLGCTPGLAFPGLSDIVRGLVGDGFRVSIDSLDPGEIALAVDAGASLVLSITHDNVEVLDAIAGRDTRVVVIPELAQGLDSLAPLIAAVERAGVSYLVDPIIEPIGFGFTESLVRYATARARWPDAELMMGVGNITELTAADTTGMHALLIGICQELRIRTVLTTEVIPWARGAVREIDIARRLMHHALAHGMLPKRIDDRLVTLKDPKVLTYDEGELRELQRAITDPNFRIFTDRAAIYVLNRDRFVRGTDIQEIFDQLGVDDPAHAFYLGKELARAKLALTLGKTYRQEGALQWGYLTPPDDPVREHVKLARRRGK